MHSSVFRSLNIFIQLALRGLFYFFSASAVSKQSRYDFLSGKFDSFPCTILIVARKFKFVSIYIALIYKALFVAVTCSDFVPEKLKAEDALKVRNSGLNSD